MTATVGKAARRARALPRTEYRSWARRLPVDPDLVLYESNFGRGMLCNPEAIFRAARAAPDLARLRHVWVVDSAERRAAVAAPFADDDRVTFVVRHSRGYERALATAGTLVNNSTFPPHFAKRPEQLYVNTWHGTPLKVMGYDEPDGHIGVRNTVRNFLQCDLLLSSGPWMTERMYLGAYRLGNIGRALVVEEGQPRTDRQFVDEAGREQLRTGLRRLGVRLPHGDRVVVLAPTWHGISFADPVDDLGDLAARTEELARRVGPGTTVLLRVHPQLGSVARARSDLAGRLVPEHVPTNDVLALADLLVTDYSSIFFDYLPLGRPLVFFTPEHETYLRERGLYLDPAELPGPVVSSVEALARAVVAAGTGGPEDPLVTHGAAAAAAVRTFAARDDGGAAERWVDIIFRGARTPYAVRPLPKDDRPRILVFLGGMKSNGITSAALGLLSRLDPARFDVTALYGAPTTADQTGNIALVPDHVRRVTRIAGFAPSLRHLFSHRALLRWGCHGDSRRTAAMAPVLAEEWRRCLGAAEFDHVVDFSGYSPFWAFLLAQAPAGSRSVWQHNDLLADQQRRVGRRQPHRTALGAIFTAYRHFHHLVSVSEALRDINAVKLAAYAPQEAFSWARNTIDAERVLAGAAAAERPVEPPAPGVTRFVAVGRISPEKNHQRLVRAFALVHAECSQTDLVIVGDGPLRTRVEATAAELGVAGAVTVTGMVANPWAVMSDAHVFVLSSDYEGQPMVILEALVVGLPVVTTAFGSVAGALPPGSGLVVDRDVEALAGGMRAALRGEVPAPPFDAVGYNAAAVADFLRAVGARGAAGPRGPQTPAEPPDWNTHRRAATRRAFHPRTAHPSPAGRRRARPRRGGLPADLLGVHRRPDLRADRGRPRRRRVDRLQRRDRRHVRQGPRGLVGPARRQRRTRQGSQHRAGSPEQRLRRVRRLRRHRPPGCLRADDARPRGQR